MKRLLLFMLLLATVSIAKTQDLQVDYRFAPQWHASCISFPDDTCKTLVGPLGQLLYHFGTKDFFPYANERGFQTSFHILADEQLKFSGQQLQDAKVPVVITEASGNGVVVKQYTFAYAENYMKHGTPTQQGNREDLILTEIHNTTSTARVMHPVIVVNTTQHVTTFEDGVGLTDSTGKKVRLTVSEKIIRARQNMADSTRKTVLELAPVTVQPGETARFLAVYDNGYTSTLANQLHASPAETVLKATQLWQIVTDYWQTKSSVPYSYITVPDKEIQHLLNASVRGIWQARERKKDSIAFQVGPTCYRGLWIVDGAFLLETATMLGRGQEARQGIEYMLSFQQSNGGFRKMTDDYWKENGIVLWACVRHALLTQDKAWLESKWDLLSKTVEYIKTLRKTTLSNTDPLDDGLMPPGEIDGGLWGEKGKAEYSNVYWNLIGLKAMIQAADWLGKQKQRSSWQTEYNDFYSRFKASAQRDAALDNQGNRYIPIVMDPAKRSLPQRAQWVFCQAVYPGQIFEPNDELLIGTMKMLEATLQEGMVMGTGWLPDGIWNYFSSFYGHAGLWLGEKRKVVESLYAFANHASPLYAWREEQNPRDLQARYVGDMPHNWASAEFIRLVAHMLALDRGNELHLLQAMPHEWLKPGMVTKLDKLNTVFGYLTMELVVDNRGETASLTVSPLTDRGCKHIFVHLGNGAPIQLDPKKSSKLTIAIK